MPKNEIRKPALFAGAILALLLALGTTTAVAAPLGPNANACDLPTLEKAARILGSARGKASAAKIDALTARLVALGQPSVPCLLALRHRFAGIGPFKATSSALAKLDPKAQYDYVLDEAGKARDEKVRQAALVALPDLKGPNLLQDLLLLFPTNPPRLKSVAERALVKVLERESGAQPYNLIRSLLRTLPEEARARILNCVAEAGQPDGFKLLAAELGSDPALDPVIVSGLARVPNRSLSPDLLPLLKKLLTSDDPMIRKQATIALGHVQDPTAVKLLVGLLKSKERGLVKNACWSLQQISGLSLPPDANRWHLWYEEEMKWWQKKGQALFAKLKSEEGSRAAADIAKVEAHPLFRSVFAADLTELAGSADGSLSATAQGALDHLGLSSSPPSPVVMAAAKKAFLSASSPRRPSQIPSRAGTGGSAGAGGIAWTWIVVLVIAGGFVVLFVGRRFLAPLKTAWAAPDSHKKDVPITIRPRPMSERFRD